jgi:hypothetical protein
VQWSKKRHPFVPEADPASGALGMMTLNTSAVLPLQPGTWYYRVRGYDYSLPENAQAMSWSEPQKVVVSRPIFTVVRTTAAARRTVRTLSSAAAGLSIQVPRSFRVASRTTAARGPAPRPLGPRGARVRLSARDLTTGAALFVQTAPERGSSSHSAWVRRAIASAKAAPGRVGAVRCGRVSLPAAAGVRCTLTTRGSGGTSAAVLLFLQHRNVTYTLTYAGSTARRAFDAGRFDAAARTLRFTA